MKSFTALKILMTVLTVLVVAMFASLWILLAYNNNAEQPEAGMAIALALTLVITGIPSVLLSLAMIATDICLFAVKKKLGRAVGTLVVLCVGLPIFALEAIYYIALSVSIPLLNLLYFTAIAVYIATFAICCVAVSKLRAQKKLDATQDTTETTTQDTTEE